MADMTTGPDGTLIVKPSRVKNLQITARCSLCKKPTSYTGILLMGGFAGYDPEAVPVPEMCSCTPWQSACSLPVVPISGLTTIVVSNAGVMPQTTITVSRRFFEHLLGCLANQKFLCDVNADGLDEDTDEIRKTQREMQVVIDKAYRDGWNMLCMSSVDYAPNPGGSGVEDERNTNT